MKTINKLQRIAFGVALAVALLLPAVLPAQSGFKGTALPSTINTAYDELVPRLSPDDKTLYFVRFQHPENVGGRGGGQDIWYSTREDAGNWATARNAGAPLNNQHHNFVGAVLEQGNAVLLGNGYGTTPDGTTPGISMSRRTGSNWSAPTTVLGSSTFAKDSRFIDFYATPDGSLLIVSIIAAGTGNEDLAVCFAQGNGHFTPPQPLGDIINTENGFETGPYLSPDTKTLFFTSNGLGGQGGADIFVSTRLDDSWSNWSEPVNLGPEVNTAGFDGHFIMDSKREKGYFVSGPSIAALGDIYEIPIAAIPALKTEAPDTLRIYTNVGLPKPLNLEPFGINAGNARFVGLQPLGGPGLITPNDDEATFTYRPSGVWQGVEAIAVTICDPPQSDNCRKVIVEAHVTSPEKPVVAQMTLRTPKNTPISVNLDRPGMSLPEIRRNYNAQPGPKAELVATPGGPSFVYRPAKDFVGGDSVRIYGICPNGETSNCLVAVVQIEVYDVPAVVAMIDTPTVVAVIDTPKVVVPVVVTPVDTTPAVVVVIETPKPTDVTISGIVTDEMTGKPVDAEIIFYAVGQRVASTMSDPKTGAYTVTLPANATYQIEAKQPYYFQHNDEVSTGGKAAVKGQVQRDMKMTPIPMEAGQTFVLKNIYFDLDKSILKPESKEELTRLYDLLSNYPNMEIRVNGHTDNQASDEYNQKLSESRAGAVVNYLKYKGVMGYRMSSQGFGEKVPVSTNETVEGRALNRRVEFTIIKM